MEDYGGRIGNKNKASLIDKKLLPISEINPYEESNVYGSLPPYLMDTHYQSPEKPKGGGTSWLDRAIEEYKCHMRRGREDKKEKEKNRRGDYAISWGEYRRQETGGYDLACSLTVKRREDIDKTRPTFEQKTDYYRGYELYSPGLRISRAPRYILGYGVLGRTFPTLGIIQIRDDLHGDEFQEVLTHELIHARNPELSEYEVRAKTRRRIFASGRRPVFH